MKNPNGICLCGCGRPTKPSPTSRRGYKRGEPLRYLKGHQSRLTGPDYRIEDTGSVLGPCWLWNKSIGSEGYGRIWQPETRDHKGAHVVYYEKTWGDVPEGCEVHHDCGERSCVNPHHLVAVTRREHMASDGRHPYGNPDAKAAKP
jgi:hypothetical protein